MSQYILDVNNPSTANNGLLDVSALNSVASFGYMEDEKTKTWDEIQRKAAFDARVNFN